MKKFIFITALLLSTFSMIKGNDGVYFTSGSFLVPTQETDISVAKEILTITIGKDSFATVDVYYEFVNNSQAKNVTMAFEASSPYNDLSPLNHQGKHPHIKDFTVNMNGSPMTYRNAVVARKFTDTDPTDFTPLDLTKWKGYGEVPDSILPENDVIYNPELDSVSAFAYAYYFDAPFKQGKNIVHHTYKYRMSYNVMENFEIPYWLTPAMRWANHQVDDFTLKITSEEPTEFCLEDSLFRSTSFKSTKHTPIYQIQDPYLGESKIFAQLSRNDTIVWHSTNFKPIANMDITSPRWEQDAIMNKWNTSAKMVVTPQGKEYKYIADCGENYLVENKGYQLIPKNKSRIVEYLAEEGKGWLYMDHEIASQVNIHKQPTTKSAVLCKISTNAQKATRFYPCLGLLGNKQWYKIKVGKKIGYVKQDLILWTAIKR